MVIAHSSLHLRTFFFFSFFSLCRKKGCDEKNKRFRQTLVKSTTSSTDTTHKTRTREAGCCPIKPLFVCLDSSAVEGRMSEQGSSEGALAAEVIRKECRILSSLLDANRRPRVYRHHRFYRRSRHALTLAKKCFAGTRKRKNGAQSAAKRTRALLSLQRCVVRAVEDCTAELAASRIDTVALSLACVSVLSRLGCCVARVVVASTDRDVAAQLLPATLLTYIYSAPMKPRNSIAPAATLPGGHGEPVARDSFGGVLNTLVRRNTLKKK